MDWYRLLHTIKLCMTRSAIARAKYIRKHNIFHHMGKNCMVMFRKIPLYPQLISFGDNVWIASNVTFATHDVIHQMLNNCVNDYEFQENIGCIDIGNNVFVGANTVILSNVKIGSNTVIAAGSYVNKDIEGNGVYGGVPAKYISSFESFIEKRKQSETINIKKEKEMLSDKTIQACWDRYRRLKAEK
ncbi:MAG: acyltransferase [Salinivirgaceae bacterium]|nr:acyltransferase [Salinivirgaceae bacterium]